MIHVHSANMDFPDTFHPCFRHFVNFNDMVDTALDRSTLPCKEYSLVRSALTSYIAELGLSDPWHILHTMDRDYTVFVSVHHSVHG